MTSGWSLKRSWQSLETGSADTVDAVYGEARSACPVVRVSDGDGPGFWAVLGHDVLNEVVADTATFSNVVPLYPTRRPPLESDPPEHTAYRRLLAAHFSSGRTAMMEPKVREFAREMLRPLLNAGQADFARDLADPLPTRVLCHLLGIPDADWPLINDMAAALHRVGAERRDNANQRAELGAALRDYASRLIAARRHAAPRDDVIGALLAARIEDAPLTDATITGIVMMLISAGHNTTTSLLGNAVLHLARNPGEQQRLRDAPAAIPAAIEELLRLEAPQQAMPRVATRDVELAGCPIREGDHVWPVFGAANLDPGAFDEPGDYRPDRHPNRHLAFGRGLHRCIGAPLAQLQGRVVIEELLAATRAITLAGPVTRFAWPRMGVRVLPVRLDPQRA
jgi:cytochrome P450